MGNGLQEDQLNTLASRDKNISLSPFKIAGKNIITTLERSEYDSLIKKYCFTDIGYNATTNITKYHYLVSLAKTPQDLEEFLKDVRRTRYLSIIYDEIFIKILELYNITTLKELEQVFLLEDVGIYEVKDKNIYPILLHLLRNVTKEERGKFWKNQEIQYIIKYVNKTNLEFFLKLFNISFSGELEDKIQILAPKREHYKKAMKNCSDVEIKEIYEKSITDTEAVVIDQEIRNTTVSINICPVTEWYFFYILKGEKWSYKKKTLVRYQGKVLGYIKWEGVNTFLSLRDVYDTAGNLIFAKGWIYNLANEAHESSSFLIWKDETGSVERKKNIDLGLITKRNPLKKISEQKLDSIFKRLKKKECSFEELVDTFLKKVASMKQP